jgi:RNA polymerase-binding transcription factor DksA
MRKQELQRYRRLLSDQLSFLAVPEAHASDRRLLDMIQQALNRIESGTFGKCEGCGSPIDPRRLQARPVTTLCVACGRFPPERR